MPADEDRVKNQLHRWVYWPIWFVVVPLALAALTVWILGSGDGAFPEGFIGRVRYFVQDQKVPAIIIFFVLFEMGIYQLRHSLPFASALGLSGRPGLPRERSREFESAAQLVEATERLLRTKKREIASELGAEAYGEVDAALLALNQAMHREQFSIEEFDRTYEGALTLTSKHLSRWKSSEAKEYFESIFVAVAVALILRAFLVEAFKIPSGSMLPTLQINDHIFVNKMAYGPVVPFTRSRVLADLPPKHGDIVVFEFPDSDPGAPRQDYIKRVMAGPGDVLEVRDGHPTINGWAVPFCRVGTYSFGSDARYLEVGELFVEYLHDVAYLTFYEKDGPRGRQGPYRVKEGEFWVMGDNRHNSSDSRAWRHGRGAGVPFENVKGRAMFVWLSFDDQGGQPLGVTWDRLFTNVMGRPRLPKEAPEELKRGIERCLASRPAQTTPPPPQADAASIHRITPSAP